MARSKGQPEHERGEAAAQDRARRDRKNAAYRRKYANDPEFRARVLARKAAPKSPEAKARLAAYRRDRYQNNKQKCNDRRTKWRRKNRERANAYYRDYYAKNKPRLTKQIREARHRADPTIGIHTAAERLKKGDIGFDDFTKDLGERIARIDAIADKARKGRGSDEAD